MKIDENLIIKVLKTAFMAGKAIMEVYSKPFDFELKTDNSPLTIADKKAALAGANGLIVFCFTFTTVIF